MHVFSLAKILSLIEKANDHGVNISFSDGEVSVHVEKGKQIDRSLMEELRENKSSLVYYFTNFASNKPQTTDTPHIGRFDRNKITRIPLSFAQERLWFIDQLEGSVQYHLPTVLTMTGKLNRKALEHALKVIINRHEILRTTIHEENGHGFQKVNDENEGRLHIVDGSRFKNDKSSLEKFIKQLIRAPFDLSKDQMVRADLIAIEDEQHVLVVTMHHIASDAWSTSVLVKEVAELYQAFNEGREARLLPIEIQYADYAVWQRNYLQGEVLDKKIDYWKNKLEGLGTVQLPTDFVRPAFQNSDGANAEFNIDKKLADQLQKLSKQQGTTLYMVLLAAFKIMLHRYSGQSDICVGTSIASREHPELENLIGFFVNTLALRTEINKDEDFPTLLQKVRNTTLQAYENVEVPFEKVVEAVIKERDPGRNPLFQIMLVLANTPEVSQLRLGELQLTKEDYEPKISKFDITFFVTETPTGFHGLVQYRTDLFTDVTVRKMITHFKQLLASIVASPEQQVGSFRMLTEAEEQTLLTDFNKVSVLYPKDKTIVDLFEEKAGKFPGEIALSYEGRRHTFRELNEKANQLAHYLRTRGVREDSLVPLCVERSDEMIIGMLGILKAGGAYVPMEPDFPEDRKTFLLEDTQASVIICSQQTSGGIPVISDLDIIEVDGEWSAIKAQPVTNPATGLAPHHLAYVIYTSGSTGRPKGVMIEHRNLVDYVFGLKEHTPIAECRSYALVSSIATDLGNTVIYAALAFGGALHVFSKESVSNIEYLHEYFAQNTIDCVKIVPSHWKALSHQNQLLLPKRLLVFGGEALQSEIVDQVHQSGSSCTIVNHYGPTETTIGKLLHVTDPTRRYNKTIPIGKPFSNTKVYVLSKNLQLCPVGVAGELLIGGDGVARGYLNNTDLTKEKFIANPFLNSIAEDQRNAANMLYRTGDLVRWLSDGNIEFIGRVDDQVKIRGYRVELGEIESMLLQYSGIDHGAVLAKEDSSGNKRLVGYVVRNEDYDKDSMVSFLEERLPEYMVPGQWVELEEFPMLPNGKIDRKSLPDPEVSDQLSGQYVAPRNAVESKLAELWQDVLEVEQVGVHDDFFELGGHSLLAVRLVSAIRKEFVVEMPIGDIFDHPTVAQLAKQIETPSSTEILPTVELVQSRPERIPLSYSQERLWFIDTLEGSVQYHVPTVLRLQGKLNTKAIENALQTLINRHEVLRTVIISIGGQPYQKIKEKNAWTLDIVDGTSFDRDIERLKEYILQTIKKPFDLSKDYLLRAELIRIAEEDHVVVVTMHHIVSDAWSTPILVREVMELYNSFVEGRPAELPTLPIQYADYAIWQRSYLRGDVLANKLDYWKKKFEGVTPLQLPLDYPRPAVPTNRGAAINFKISRDISDKIYKVTQQQGATLFMTLLAAYQVLLHKYSGQDDIVVGTSVANRTHENMEGLMGFFVNTLALRSAINPRDSFAQLLQQVKQTTVEAYDHQDVPFEKVVDVAVKERDLNRSPLFQAMMDLQNAPEAPELKLGEASISRVPYEVTTAKFDLTFFLHESPNGLRGSVQYRTDLFTEGTIERMARHFTQILQSISDTPGQAIADIDILSDGDKRQLLDEFNNTFKATEDRRSVLQLFREQAEKNPDQIAVVCQDEQLTYKMLNERSNQLATFLRGKGVSEETLVPLCVHRSIDMLISILGVLKAGAAYVPIDPGYPAERINYLIEDTRASIIITTGASIGSLPPSIDADIVVVDDDWTVIGMYPSTELNVHVSPNSLAYVIYTSGSTGKPKGVLIEHRQLLSYLLNDKTRYINPESQSAGTFVHLSYTFDASLTGLFMPLLFGKSVVIGSKQSLDVFEDDNLEKFAPYDFIKITPSHIELLQPKMRTSTGSLLTRRLVIGGEALFMSQFENFRNDDIDIEIVNEYGPTETTVGCSVFGFRTLQAVENGKNDVSIGKPIDNVEMYIVDANLHLTPVGVPGEIFIAGAGVARGYLNRPELTNERFIENPFSSKWKKMYKTGDIGRWLPDGNIEYLGRKDDQVKIRGYRVELGEIESVIQQNDNIRQAVVLAKDDSAGNKKLVAYVVAADEFDKESIVSFLGDKLPEYMVPGLWVTMESFPLTSNGKIDKRALPDPEPEQGRTGEYVAPRNETERKLAEIWQDLLEVEQVGIHDSFFELGGHSLLTVRLISAIRREFVVELPISAIFDYPTVALLAAEFENLSKEDVLPPVEHITNRPERIPLSFSQERLWFIDQLEGSLQYHVPTVLRLRGQVNRQALNNSLKQLVNRHETLRTIFKEEDGKPYQQIMDKDQWELSIVDGTPYSGDAKGLQEYVKQLEIAPFDLAKDHAIRGHLIVFGEEDHVLVVTLHHIASDGWSISVLVKELLELYNSQIEHRTANLPALEIQYADFAIWQRNLFDGDEYEKKLGYWKNKLQEPTPLELPTDHPRPAVWSTHGASVNFTIEQELRDKLHTLSQQKGATLFMTMLTAFKVLLYRYSGQQDIMVGSAIAGRQQQALEDLIGFFVNTLVFRSEINPDEPFTDLLQQVKKTTMEAFAHQEVPFEKVVEAVLNQRSLSKNPLVQVMFALLNTPDVPDLRLGDVQLSREGVEHTSARFDITFFVTETPHGMNGTVEYATDLYNEETIVRMIGHYKELLKNIVSSPERKINSFSILTAPEKQQLLVDFNQTTLPLQKDKTLVDLFEGVAKQNPSNLAIVFESERLTYKDVDERANKIAHHLLSLGIQKETLVPICIDRSANLLVGILGILKAGAAYVPIDPRYPEDRIRFMLEDTKANILISVDSVLSKLTPGESVRIISLDGENVLINTQPSDKPELDLKPTDLVNVIYTSGSTGQPKGVAVEHKGMVNLSGWYNHAFNVSSNSRFTTMTGVGFDAFGFEIWPCLTIGAALYIVDDDTRLDTAKLFSLIQSNEITHCLVPTALIAEIVGISRNKKVSLEYLLCGGDKLASVDIDGLTFKVVNNYGPTEYSICATSYPLEAKNKTVSPAIGPPIANTSIYILNEQNELVPIGVPGEICLSGNSIARSYLNAPDLTAQKFVENPFSHIPGTKMYRTGDIGRWLSNGHIEYLRRKDDQVKIRGHRIELGEIESVLQQTGLVSQAAVVARDVREGDRRLLGYVVPDWEVVKQKEYELYRSQTDSWKELYDIEYSKSESEENIDTEFNIVGWNDSFTKDAIPAEQMREWLNDIVDIILSRNPGNVLEIGSGSGLIYYQLAGKVKKYIGTDISRSSINQIQQRINKGLRDYGPTELMVSAAHEVTLDESQEVDTIVINSVAQYFPGEDYLTNVIKKSISLLKGQGRIVVGDVRDNRLLRLFKSRLLLQRLQDAVGIREFDWLLDQDVLNEEELCYAPDYFYNLVKSFPEISHVEILWKKSSFINELTLYRYNVVVYVGEVGKVIDPAWKNWNDMTDLQSLISQVRNGSFENIAIRNVPNYRLSQERLLAQALSNDSPATVGDLFHALRKADRDGSQVMQLLNAAQATGYRVLLFPNENPLWMNLFVGKEAGEFVNNLYQAKAGGKYTFTNIPLFSSISTALQREIRAAIQQRLPEYMIPSEISVIGDLPLTRHGKIDKKFLSQRKDKTTINKLTYEAPRTEVEQVLASIWQELLGVDRIGIHDNFFELGGHSLLATRAVSAVKKHLFVELLIKDLFVYPTIAELAAHLGVQTKGLSLPPLEVQEKPGHIPLSFSQERLWFIDRFEGTLQYHIPSQLRLRGKLDRQALEYALRNVVNRHEVLRTVIREDNGVAYQHILPKDQLEISFIDKSELKNNEDALQDAINQSISSPFDLANDHMLRALLVRLGEQDHILVVTMHHISSDGWSISIIVREVVELYNSYKEGTRVQLPSLPIQYADFAIWQRKNITGEVLDSKIGYWKKKLHEVAPLQLPTDYSRPPFQSTRGSYSNFRISKELSSALVGLSQQNGTTLFMTLLAAFKVLLHRYSGQEDICVGTPIAGRQQQEVEDLVGFFINTLALRTEVQSETSFAELLQQVKTTTLEAYAHQELPFEKVVDVVVKERNLARSPLFQVMFIFQNTPEVPAMHLGDVQLIRENSVHETAKFEISINISQTPQGVQGSVEYCTDLYTEPTIQRLIGHYTELLQSIVQAPQQQIGKLRMLPEQELQQLLYGFNGVIRSSASDQPSVPAYPTDKTIVDLIEEQVDKFPSNIAVVSGEQRLTYQQLNEKANRIAHALRAKGVGPDSLVPVCLERNADMILSIVAVLKAGGAYVPVDPDYPLDRIHYMVTDTGSPIVIAEEETISRIEGLENVEAFKIDREESLSDHPVTNPRANIKPENLAYVIYTSGSTGKPKGVLIEHRNVVRLFKTDSPLYDFNEDDVWSVFHSFCFDFSVWEMYGALFYGGKMVVVPKHVTKDVGQFAELILSEKVTVLNQTPSAFYVLQDALIEKTKDVPVRYVIFGGEALNPVKLQPWKQTYPGSRLINMYGITETTVHVTFQEIDWKHVQSSGSVIGKPIPTLNLYIVDRNLNPVPIGVSGEILVGGAGLARGYLHRAELTAERFISHPFSEEPGARVYRSGDAGTWLADGTVEYFGRIDEQVKIRGYRIELGEIESVIHESGFVRQAVVVAKTDKEGNKRLVGYVVPETTFRKESVIAYLQDKLPDYMVPALWVEMESLPLTSNGKINKKALPDPDASALLKNDYVAPRTELETNLAEIWRGLLNVGSVGIRDNFFELGGDSILTIQVVNRARRLGYELQPKDIFIHQTIERLAESILKHSAVKITGEQGVLTGAAELTAIQQWFLQGDDQSRSHFNQSILLGIDKTITPLMLTTAIEKLVEQHDALRFTYYQKDGTWYQEYTSKAGHLTIEDCTVHGEKAISTVITEKANQYQQSLDIEKGDIYRIVLMQTPETEAQNRLLFIVHHLAIDGVSWRILIENLEFLLSGLQKNQPANLGLKTSSYRQWYSALKEYGLRRDVLAQVEYWEKVSNSYKPLARDKESAKEFRLKNMGNQFATLGTEATQKLLQEVPKAYHTEINDMLICALAMTLGEWGQTGKVIVGMEGHGREDISSQIDISQTVGWFTSLYPVLIDMESSQNLSETIKSVKEQLRQIPGKGLGYGVLKYINRDKKLSANPGWHVAFNYLGQFDNVVKNGQWLSGARESAGHPVGEKHLMNEQLQLTASVQGGQLVMNWIYNAANYDKDSMNDLVHRFKSNLESLINHCTTVTEPAFTPFDFGLSTEISFRELDKFMDEDYNGLPRRKSLKGLYRLSGLQQGMLFHGVYDERSGAYIDQFSCDLSAPNLDAFKQSWKKVIQHHSILRSAFYADTFSVPVQAVYADVELPVTVVDYRRNTIEEQEEQIKKYIDADRAEGFNFKAAPLMRVTLFQVTDTKFKMLWTSHHLLFDGWSLPVLMEEFLSSYELLISGKELPAFNEDRYEDYIRYIERSDKENEETYWKNYLEGVEHGTMLPFIELNAERTKAGGVFEMHYLNLDEKITEQIKTFSQNNRITVNTIMQGVWSYLLHQYTGSNDVVFGVVVSGRPDDLPGVEQRVGMYINTLPLHSSIDKNVIIADWFQQIQAGQVASRQYQFTPLQNIQLLSAVKGDLFDNILVFENYPVSKVVAESKWSLKVSNVQMKEQTNYPLTITVGSSDQINVVFHYNTYLLTTERIQGISSHFERVLLQLIRSDAKQLSDITMLTEAEQVQVVEQFNDNKTIFPAKSIPAVFEEQVSKSPGSIALVSEQGQLTYKELNERSNQLAHYLVSRGVGRESLVPLCIEKSADMMVAILAILKAGGAYVPLDIAYPPERIKFMIDDTNAKLIVTNRKNRASLNVTGPEIVEIDSETTRDMIGQQPTGHLANSVDVNQLAYVMYTSGSTGRPKGTLVEQGNVVSLVKGVDYVSISESDILLSTGSASFDATTFEYWSMLLNGGRLVLCNETRLLDSTLLKDEIHGNHVTIMWFTSSWFNQLVETDITVFTGLKTILVGGEKLSEYHIRKMRLAHPSTEIINGYGPTENTTFSLTYNINTVSEGKSIPVGKPLNNRTAYILNESMQPVPVGITGEIYLGGAGVSRGYLNREDLTNERFVSNPFAANRQPPAANGQTSTANRLYKTGDLGRWLPDGNIEYQGRIDDQVKIRGFRIELDEINSVIQQSGLVSQSVVIVKVDAGGNKRLVGYVVPEGQFSKDSLVAFLKGKLPDYMIPVLWVELEALPLTKNGKVDKKALPDPEAGELLINQYLAPRNELESALVDIWKKLLRIESVGVKDKFFEVGGHSLLAMRLLSVLRREFGVDIPLVEIFDCSIESLVWKISDLRRHAETGILELAGQSDDFKPFKEVELGQRVEAGLEWGHNTNGKYMIPLTTDGSRLPFFGIISFNSYRLLGKYMTKDQPLYYLPPTQAASVEDIATHYVKEIKQSQPAGPYIIGGFCGGGKIAVEVAQQLEAMGDTVSALVLFEFYSPRAAMSRKTLTYKKRRLNYYKKRLMTLSKEAGSPVDLVKYVVGKSLGKLKKPISKPAPPKYLTNPEYDKYKMKPYGGKVILFQASITPLEYDGSPLMGWSDVFTGDVEVVPVQGGHLGIFREPAVKLLAEELGEILEEVNAEVVVGR